MKKRKGWREKGKKGKHKENERGDRDGRRKEKGFFHSYGKKKSRGKGKRKGGKKRKKEKRHGENAELSKNGGEILRGRLSGEKNEEKGRYAKK